MATSPSPLDPSSASSVSHDQNRPDTPFPDAHPHDAASPASAPSESSSGTPPAGQAASPTQPVRENFFLRRPIFSTVISLIITLVGALAIGALPIEQYPDLTPPQVSVSATYSGASAETVAETVASLLESQVNGVENMIYMNSVSAGTGSMSLNVAFAVGTDPDQAVIDVNNRVQLALPQLPQAVQLAFIPPLQLLRQVLRQCQPVRRALLHFLHLQIRRTGCGLPLLSPRHILQRCTRGCLCILPQPALL